MILYTSTVWTTHAPFPAGLDMVMKVRCRYCGNNNE